MSDRYFDIEKYIAELPWSTTATESEKTLVAGNLRRFFDLLSKRLNFCDALEGSYTQEELNAVISKEEEPFMEFVYCENCGIVPYVRDFMPSNDRNDHDAEDVVCAKCHLIIVTFHAAAQQPESERRAV